MFGAQPGEERRQGVMNEYMITCLVTPNQLLWVFHTRGEDPLSVYIHDLTKRKAKADTVRAMVCLVREKVIYRTSEEFERVKDMAIITWGASSTLSGATTLAERVKAMTESGMLGYTEVTKEASDER